jgi:hypothetical protein
MPTFTDQPNFQLNASRRTLLSGLDALAAKHGDLIFTCHGGAINET